MKKILLPTDFSSNSYQAMSYAVRLFKNEDCKFYLLNTFTPVLYDTEYLLYNSTQPDLEEMYRENSRRGLNRMLTKLKKNEKNSKHSYEIISSFNLLIDEIKEQVKEKKIDLVVMGTQGATGAREILIGTNTVQAMKKVKCPLLAVPSEVDFKNPTKILFPTDYGINYTKDQLELLKFIALEHKATIQILHIYLGETLNAIQEENKKKLSLVLQEVQHKYFSVEKNSLSQGIYDFQKESDADFLVMINNKHSFFENLLFRPVVNRIGFHIKVPFLVIPSGKYSA